MANKRITDVDSLNSLNGSESFFVNQNNSLRQISRENLNIYSKTEVDTIVSNINSVPVATMEDNNKFLRVVNGVATWQTVSNAEEVSV